jgi:malonyl-CoA O-methyltransferase
MKPKQSLVFIPGWGADKRIWKNLELHLSECFDVKHFDLMLERPFSAKDSELNAFIDRLVEEIACFVPQNSIVVGWSLGGMLSAKLAYRFRGKVEKLILISSNLSFVERSEWLSAMKLPVFEQFLFSFEQAPEKTKKRFISLQAKGVKQYQDLVKKLEQDSALTQLNSAYSLHLLRVLGHLEIKKEIESLDIPVLFVFGENDALVPSSVVNETKKIFADDARKQVGCIPGCGHVPQFSHGEELKSLIFEFLEIRNPGFWKDKKKIANSFSKAATRYDQYAGLQKEVAEELVCLAGELEGRVVDLGCGTGFCLERIAINSNKVRELVGLDIAENMLQQARRKAEVLGISKVFCLSDIENLPFKSGSIDCFVSSLAIQWCEDLNDLFLGVADALSEQGRFALSTLGTQTLRELNSAWQLADPSHVHINQFFTDEELIEAAENAGFELELFKLDFKTLAYDQVIDLMRDLKGIGAHNVNSGINKGLTGKDILNALIKAYEKDRNSDGKLPATYEVQYWLLRKKRVLK